VYIVERKGTRKSSSFLLLLLLINRVSHSIEPAPEVALKTNLTEDESYVSNISNLIHHHFDTFTI
jgi:hypothetical protein